MKAVRKMNLKTKITQLVKMKGDKNMNTKFKMICKMSQKELKKYEMPEVNYFLKECVPAFSLTLDELDLEEL